MTSKFPGGQPDLDAARALLERVGLARDQHLGMLVGLRGERNQLRSQKVEVGTARESEVIRRWIGGALLPLNRLRGERVTATRERVDYLFTFDVRF